MATGIRSRAFKLQLSAEGIQLFLRGHCRLCRLVGDLLPHGATLYVAVAGLRHASGETIAACLLDPELDRLGGRIVRYVGTSPALADHVEDAIARATTAQPVHPTPQVWKTFLVALMLLEERDDRRLLKIYDEVCGEIGRSPSDC
ncbi:hypothetical protein ACIQCS_21365 [Sphingomonas sp. NPDC092440]|jgi:hypothetical protein|uniref:hypothetical protein n=2 Tax=Sphingomonas TaxID=13687 RepID=UPI00382F3B81